MVKKIIVLLIIILIISCGPSEDELTMKINDEFSKLLNAYPTSTPVPTATPIPYPTPVPTATPIPYPTPVPTATSIPYPTPVPTATPIALIDVQEDIKNLLENPYATPVPSAGLDVSNLYKKYRKSVVKIENGGSVGTGWAISEDYIVTNEHVITGSGNQVKIFVPSTDGSITSQIGLVKSWDSDLDLALIKCPNHGAIPLKTKTTTSSDTGTAVFQIGYSTGVENYPAVRHGIIVSIFNQLGNSAQYGNSKKFQILDGLNYSEDLLPIIVVNTGADPGDSGGPIIDYNGNVLGVIFAQVQSVGGSRVIGQQLAIGSSKLDFFWSNCISTTGACD
ncbi:MAG: trypsin-like peptidase domain-containing protein [Dehalococcoidia bacterium]|nr:trypsin-like peptidase domain-containing protein [Chloroflexota bacterium]